MAPSLEIKNENFNHTNQSIKLLGKGCKRDAQCFRAGDGRSMVEVDAESEVCLDVSM